MTDAEALVASLRETALARVALPHDEARARYPLSANTVPDFRVFENGITDYTIHHHRFCGLPTAGATRMEFTGLAKELVEQAYRRRRSDIVGAYNAAHDGTDSGLRGVLDAIADELKGESIRRYIREQFDSRVAPNDHRGKVEIMRQFFQCYGAQLADAVDVHDPGRYAHSYQELINALVQGLRETSSLFRRL